MNEALLTFTNEDKVALRNNTAAIKSKIIVKASGQLPEIILSEENSIKDWNYTDDRIVPGEGFIGQFVARTLSGNLQNISDTFSIEGREIELQLGIYRRNDDIETWYTLGNFLITEPTDDEVKDNTKFDAMDYTKLFNKKFDGGYTDEEFTTSYNTYVGVGLSDEQLESFTPTPVSMLWLVRYTCKQVGITLATTNFTNKDFTVTINPFQAGESCRDVIKAVAQIAFTWARIGWDNRLYLDFVKISDENVDTLDILDNNQYFGLTTKKEKVGPIDFIGFGLNGIDGETATESDPTSDGSHPLYFYNNPLLPTFESRQQIATSGAVLFGLTYTQLETETIGHPWLCGPRLINIKDMENNNNYTYPFNSGIKYTGHIRSQISSMDDSQIEKTLGYSSDFVQELRDALIEVNKQDGTIRSMTRRIQTISDDLSENYYTSEQVNDLLEDENGLTNRYINSGGANIFRNSGLWYQDTSSSGFEYWTGLVDVMSESRAGSSTAMKLQNGRVSQNVSGLVSGQDYTISFKFEKLQSLANIRVYIGSNDYSQYLSEGRFETTINVSGTAIDFTLECDVDNGIEVYDLMGNRGTVASVWSQHPNEIRTDTVNISRGITITSSVMNIKFKADFDGIRIDNQVDNTTTEFTDDGMITNTAEIKNQATISGTLHSRVGNQTWITGIM